MTEKPRPSPGESAKDDPNLGQKDAEREKAELTEADHQEDDDDPNLGQKEAEEEQAEIKRGKQEDEEFEPKIAYD